MQGCTAQDAGRDAGRAIANQSPSGDDESLQFARSGKEMDRSSLRPLVGISACLKENGRGGWHHTVGDKYVQAAIRAVGALPVLIPAIGPEFEGEAQLTADARPRCSTALDGMLLTGSPSNVEPHHYGKESRPGTAARRRRATPPPCR